MGSSGQHRGLKKGKIAGQDVVVGSRRAFIALWWHVVTQEETGRKPVVIDSKV
jgi:hypothetical protein